MKIAFSSADLALSCNLDEMRLRTYGPQLAPVLRRRLGEIAAADHLGELRSVPAARLRPDPALPGAWMLVALGNAADLRVRPGQQPPPVLADGRLNEFEVRELLIAAVASHD